jgi:hypothetical protein
MRVVWPALALRLGVIGQSCGIWGVMFLQTSSVAYCLTTKGLEDNGIEWSELTKWSKIGVCIF